MARTSTVVDIRQGFIARLQAELVQPLRLNGYVVADFVTVGLAVFAPDA